MTKILTPKEKIFIQNICKAYTEGIYADTPANRKLGRVGMSYKEYAAKMAGEGDNKENKSQKNKKEEIEGDSFINKSFSEATNKMIKKAIPYFKPIEDIIDNNCKNSLKESSIANKVKYILSGVGGNDLLDASLFTDGKGNFWNFRYSPKSGDYAVKLKENELKHISKTIKRTPKYINNLIKKGKIESYIKELKEERKEKIKEWGYDNAYSWNEQELTYINCKLNKDRIERLYSRLEDIAKTKKYMDRRCKNEKDDNPFVMNFGNYRIYMGKYSQSYIPYHISLNCAYKSTKENNDIINNEIDKVDDSGQFSEKYLDKIEEILNKYVKN